MTVPVVESPILAHSPLEGTTEAQLLEQLLRSPRLPVVAEALGAKVAEEAARRQQFIDTVLESEKAEFINGEKIVHSPVKLRHNAVTKRLLVLLDTYVNAHQLGYVGYEKLFFSLSRNDYEPDICFFNAATAAVFEPDQMRFPAPDFVVEVLSASTAANDRGIKFEDYAAHGVREYWIIDPDAETVEQYDLAGSAYSLAIKAQTGELHSRAVPNFVIPVRALFDDAIQRAALTTLLS
ncbi:MAG: Uma2 family endonuclease [Caldilineaceae bacterium]|nr:Uma2 family endonuclease [Caldilineaceae bacterium]